LEYAAAVQIVPGNAKEAPCKPKPGEVMGVRTGQRVGVKELFDDGSFDGDIVA
jgi:hypothetical protein